MVWIELFVLLSCILVGARLGGIGLGTVSGLGLVAFVFVFGLPPGMPPRTVLGMIITVVTAAATMQAAGGLNYLATLAGRALRVWPGGITIIAPIVTYVCGGDGSYRLCAATRNRRSIAQGRDPARTSPLDCNHRIPTGDYSLSDFGCNRSIVGPAHTSRGAPAADSVGLCALNPAGQPSWSNCGSAKGTRIRE